MRNFQWREKEGGGGRSGECSVLQYGVEQADWCGHRRDVLGLEVVEVLSLLRKLHSLKDEAVDLAAFRVAPVAEEAEASCE